MNNIKIKIKKVLNKLSTAMRFFHRKFAYIINVFMVQLNIFIYLVAIILKFLNYHLRIESYNNIHCCCSLLWNNCSYFVNLNNSLLSFSKSLLQSIYSTQRWCRVKAASCSAEIVKVLFFLKDEVQKNNMVIKFKMIINIISDTFLIIIFYYFMWDFKSLQAFQIFIFFIFSVSINIFISENFKLSNDKFFKFIQKFTFISIISGLTAIILYLFRDFIFTDIFCDSDSDNEVNLENDRVIPEATKGCSAAPETISTVCSASAEESLINKDGTVASVTSNIEDKNNTEYYNFKIQKDVLDKLLTEGKEIIGGGVKDIAPNIGVATVAGKAVSEYLKLSQGMAPVPRIVGAGVTALATALGAKVGIELGKDIVGNIRAINEIDASKSKLDKIDTDGRNSPSDFGGSFINSVLEESSIPLISMVNGLSYLNYIEFSLTLTLFSLILRKILYSKFKKIFFQRFLPFLMSRLNLKNKDIKNTEVASNNDESLNKVFNTFDKYTEYLIVFTFMCLFFILFINIFYSSYLAENIHSFVKVYNYLSLSKK